MGKKHEDLSAASAVCGWVIVATAMVSDPQANTKRQGAFPELTCSLLLCMFPVIALAFGCAIGKGDWFLAGASVAGYVVEGVLFFTVMMKSERFHRLAIRSLLG